MERERGGEREGEREREREREAKCVCACMCVFLCVRACVSIGACAPILKKTRRGNAIPRGQVTSRLGGMSSLTSVLSLLSKKGSRMAWSVVRTLFSFSARTISACPSAPETRLMSNHDSKEVKSSKISGRRKFSKDHSSDRLFWKKS